MSGKQSKKNSLLDSLGFEDTEVEETEVEHKLPYKLDTGAPIEQRDIDCLKALINTHHNVIGTGKETKGETLQELDAEFKELRRKLYEHNPKDFSANSFRIILIMPFELGKIYKIDDERIIKVYKDTFKNINY